MAAVRDGPAGHARSRLVEHPLIGNHAKKENRATMGVTSLSGCVVSLLSDLGIRDHGRRIVPPMPWRLSTDNSAVDE